MHHRKGSFVKGHYREGSWVNSHYRSETTVSDLIDVVKNRAYKHLQDKKSFVIRCWWCEKYVYFFRNENGGCALFEKLGSPWIVHPCWEANYKNSDSELIKEILDKKEHDIVESKVDNYVLYQDINVSVIHESFLIGADFSKRTVINPKDFYSEKSVSFRHFIYLINDKFVELLFPEDSVNILLKEPHLFLKVFSIDKMSRKIFFIHEARLHIDDESFIVDEKNYIENYSRVNWWFHYDLDPLQILLPLQYGSFERCRKKSLDFEDLVIDNIRTAVNMLLDRLMDFYVGNSSLTSDRKKNIVFFSIFNIHLYELKNNSIEFLYNIEEEKQAFLDVNFISRKIKNLKLKDGWQNIYLDTITSLISMSEKLDDENSANSNMRCDSLKSLMIINKLSKFL